MRAPCGLNVPTARTRPATPRRCRAAREPCGPGQTFRRRCTCSALDSSVLGGRPTMSGSAGEQASATVKGHRGRIRHNLAERTAELRRWRSRREREQHRCPQEPCCPRTVGPRQHRQGRALLRRGPEASSGVLWSCAAGRLELEKATGEISHGRAVTGSGRLVLFLQVAGLASLAGASFNTWPSLTIPAAVTAAPSAPRRVQRTHGNERLFPAWTGRPDLFIVVNLIP